MEHPKAIGDRTTLAVMLGLRDAGYDVLVPFGENTRYDLVIDAGLRLARVQCKTGRLRLGSVVFATCSSYARTAPGGAGYLVPIEQAPTLRAAALRVLPCRNRQQTRIRGAADYEIAEVAITAGLRASAGAGGSSA